MEHASDAMGASPNSCAGAIVPFAKVLYVEYSPAGSSRGFSAALDLAGMLGADLTVAGVAPAPPGRDLARPLTPGADLRHRTLVRTWLRRLDDLAGRTRSTRVLVGTRVLEGGTEAVVRQVEREGHDLVLKVAGPGRWPAGLDPDDRALLRSCPCPLWILDPVQGALLEVVVAAVDVSGAGRPGLNTRIVRTAASLAALAGADLRVMHAWSVPGESILASPLRGLSRPRFRAVVAATQRERRRRLVRLLERVAPEGSVQVSLPKERPVRAIRREARRYAADVVVVGGATRTGPRAWLLGNVAEALVGHVPGSVLSLPPAPEDDAHPLSVPAARPSPRALETHGGRP